MEEVSRGLERTKSADPKKTLDSSREQKQLTTKAGNATKPWRVACATKTTKRDPTATNPSRRQMEDTAGTGGGIGRLKNHRARVQPPEAEEERETIEAGLEATGDRGL